MTTNKQIISKRRASTGEALTVDLDLREYPKSILEFFVQSSGAATFEIFGSIDGTDGSWRKTYEIVLSEAGEKSTGLSNAFRHIRVSTTAIANNLIEIAVGG